MSLSQRVHEQLAEIGIDDSDTIPEQEVHPESNDITWQAQKAYLTTHLNESEKAALSNLVAHPMYAEVTEDNPYYRDIKQGLEASERMLASIVNTRWPRRAE